MQRAYLRPITKDTGTKVLIDKKGNEYSWPKQGTNARLCDVALKNNNAVKVISKDGNLKYGTAKIELFGGAESIINGFELLEATSLKVVPVDLSEEQQQILQFIHTDSLDIKPSALYISELKWKFLIRSAMRGKNIMMTGPAGCGKTMAAKSIVNALERPDFYFNLGATQDPRATLIGNTHYDSEKGTFFSEALFVKAIQTPDSVILLDELSRAHPDAANILMTVLDEGQRYLRLDEHPDSPTIKVADGVCFIATANIGNEYTGTRVMDRALLDRFIVVEMDTLDDDQERALLSDLFPKVSKEDIDKVASIVNLTRKELSNDNARLSTHISTRSSVEMTSLIYDGFTLSEAAEVVVYPMYDDAGGLDSERTFIKQLVQKYCGTVEGNEDLFNAEDMDEDDNN